MKIEATKYFIKSAKPLAKKYRSFNEDYQNLLKELYKNPELGTDLGNGIRKIRMAVASKGKGKSGGLRVITFHTLEKNGVLYLIYIYDKSEYDNIFLPIIKQIVEDLEL